MQTKARIFMNNRSQAVRLPKEFQFKTPHDTTTNLNEISTGRECHFIRNSLKASRAAQDDSVFVMRTSETGHQ